MEKCAKDQADGKCSRTGPSAPTVGVALARSIRAGANLVFPLLLEGVAAGRGSDVNIMRVSTYLNL